MFQTMRNISLSYAEQAPEVYFYAKINIVGINIKLITKISCSIKLPTVIDLCYRENVGRDDQVISYKF